MPNSSLMPNMATMFRATAVASWMSWEAPLVMVCSTTSSAARPPMETVIRAMSSSLVRSSVLSSSGISRVYPNEPWVWGTMVIFCTGSVFFCL